MTLIANMSGSTFFLQGLDTNLPQAFLLLQNSPLAQPQGPARIEDGSSIKFMMGDTTGLIEGLTGIDSAHYDIVGVCTKSRCDVTSKIAYS